ncbi:HAD hydrolase family protein [Micromonosporaceae bacterium Da 78-11]
MPADRVAVVTDLDGTVVPSGDLITPATLKVAAELRVRNIPLVAATARTPAGIRRLGPFADELAVAVCNNGARGWSPATGATLWQQTIAVAELRDLADFARDLPGAGIAAFGIDTWKMTPDYLALRRRAPLEPWQLVQPAGIADQPAYAAAIRHIELSSDQLVAALTAAGFAARLNLTYSARNLVDIGPLGVDKASGVRQALDLLGLAPASAVAFGDMPNDLSMFAFCGRSVAVGNAHPAVRAAATITTASAADDGFAHGLAALGLIDTL